ncbi:MAG: Uma2 family endonuclease [Vulcanimicrobiaceae bacterium]
MSDMAVDYKHFPISVDMYRRMGETGILAEDARVELLDGELIEMAPISPEHQDPIRKLIAIFVKRFDERAIVDANGPVIIDPISAPQPDLMLLGLRDYLTRLPDQRDVLLVVEVALSSLRYDRGRKLSAYARAGVPEVWIVNLVDRRVERYTDLAGSSYATVEDVRRGGSIAPRAFPNDAIPVDDFLA